VLSSEETARAEGNCLSFIICLILFNSFVNLEVYETEFFRSKLFTESNIKMGIA
jgi:hypothetical protein